MATPPYEFFFPFPIVDPSVNIIIKEMKQSLNSVVLLECG